MQHKAVYLLFCKFTLRVSGVKHAQHQEYTKLTPETCRVNLKNNE